MIRSLLALSLLGCTATVPEPDETDLADTDLDVDTEAPPEPVVLEQDIDVDRMIGHLEALQAIADEHSGTRLYRTSGYLDSVDYVVTTLEDAGLAPRIDSYSIRTYREEPPSFEVIAPAGAAGERQVSILRFSGSGEVEADVTAVDLTLPPGEAPNTSTSGCEASDFDGFPEGNVALVQRGTCRFSDKVANAAAAGASAVLVFNEGQPGRRELLQGVLDDSGLTDIPALGLRFADGRDLAALDGVRARLGVRTSLEEGEDQNVLVTLPGRDPSRNLIVGAHLDSVAAGPGINDNGSGTAFLLELAEVAAAGDWQPETDVTLAWWGAEEQGLVGSRNFFLDERGEPDLDNLAGIEAYLNFDMVASRNGGRFVYDGDSSSMDQDVSNPGSVYIEQQLEDWFTAEELDTRPVGLVSRSDSYWAVVLGIPWGGLFSGAEIEKSANEVLLFGGEAGVPYDACYHLECDTLEGIDPVLYDELTRAGASLIQQLAEAETPVPAGSSATPDAPAPWVPGELMDVPRPYGCHGEAIFDR